MGVRPLSVYSSARLRVVSKAESCVLVSVSVLAPLLAADEELQNCLSVSLSLSSLVRSSNCLGGGVTDTDVA